MPLSFTTHCNKVGGSGGSHTLTLVLKEGILGFYSFSCKHTYHEHDRVGDRLSKEALKLDDGHLIAQEFMENSMREYVLNISF